MIEVKFDDILKQDVDAIVNPANRFMLHGGGLAGLIAYRAGDSLRKESRAKAPIKTGEAILSTAGKLPFKAVIHAVGPVWEDGDTYWRQNSDGSSDRDELLRKAHISAIKLAAEQGFSSLAFPAISCGVFRFPVERAAPIAIKATREAQEKYPIAVSFCLLDDSHYEAFVKEME